MFQPKASKALVILAILILTGGALFVSNSSLSSAQPEPVSAKLELATFGSGCFWCTEALFDELRGVHSAISGYSGGKKENPTYQEISTGFTGHAEVVQVEFDPQEISFVDLLEVFWKTHDPTTLNRQGADSGTQYRSVVFYHTDKQKEQAEQTKEKLDQSGAFSNPIVTEVSPFTKFYVAEDYHQQYFERHGEQPYCQAVIQPKLDKFRKAFADKLGETTSAVEDSGATIDWGKVDWKAKLTPKQYQVTCNEGTEPPFENAYWDNKKEGVYHCVRCGLPLFDSSAKYQSGSGWPSFFQPKEKKNVVEIEDRSLASVRTEIRCSRCESHLGHVFTDGPKPTGMRYCMNSAAMNFVDGDAEDRAAKEKSK